VNTKSHPSPPEFESKLTPGDATRAPPGDCAEYVAIGSAGVARLHVVVTMMGKVVNEVEVSVVTVKTGDRLATTLVDTVVGVTVVVSTVVVGTPLLVDTIVVVMVIGGKLVVNTLVSVTNTAGTILVLTLVRVSCKESTCVNTEVEVVNLPSIVIVAVVKRS